jgi:addiction module HigA family antidote
MRKRKVLIPMGRDFMAASGFSIQQMNNTVAAQVSVCLYFVHDTKSIFVAPPRIAAILKGTRKITADTAIRLSRFFGTTPGFWLNMQGHYDLEMLMKKKKTELNRISRYHEVS